MMKNSWNTATDERTQFLWLLITCSPGYMVKRRFPDQAGSPDDPKEPPDHIRNRILWSRRLLSSPWSQFAGDVHKLVYQYGKQPDLQ